MTDTQPHPLNNARNSHEPQAQQSALDWQAINSDYEKSGLSQKRYCKQANISFNQFTYQRQILNRQRYKQQKKLAKVVVRPSGATTNAASNHINKSPVSIEWPNGIKLNIPPSISPDRLKALIKTVGGCL